MLLEMVRSHELLATVLAFMWSISGVDPSMPSKLIRVEERPCIALPVTYVGLLTCVFALVIHEVRALGISFSTVVV